MNWRRQVILAAGAIGLQLPVQVAAQVLPAAAQPPAQGPAPVAVLPQGDAQILRLIEQGEAALASGDGDRAEELGRSALTLINSISADDRRRLAEPLIDRLLFDTSTDRAEALLLRMLEEVRVRDGQASAAVLDRLRLLGRFYTRLSSYGQAEEHQLAAIALSERLYGADNPDTAAVIGELAYTLVEAERFEDAAPVVSRHLELSTRLYRPDHPASLRARLMSARLQMGLNAPSVGADLATLAGDLEGVAPSDSGDRAAALAILAVARLNAGDHVGAEAAIAAANALALPSGHPARLEVLTTSVLIRSRTEDPSRLADLVMEGIREDRRSLEHPAQMRAMMALARLLLASPGRELEALDWARRAASSFDDRENRLVSRTRRPGLFGQAQIAREWQQRGRYHQLVLEAAAAAYSRPQADQDSVSMAAFMAIQQVEASPANQAMLQMIARRAASAQDRSLGDLVSERQTLEAEWQAQGFDHLLDATGTANPVAAALARARAQERIAVIDARLRDDFREYFDLVRPSPIFATELAEVLEPDELVILIVPSETQTQVMSLDINGFRWGQAERGRSDLSQATRRLLWEAGATVDASVEEVATWTAASAGGAAFDRSSAYGLYRDLIAPLGEALVGKRHLFIYATGPLANFPFNMLVTAPPTGADDDPEALRATPWLADSHAISLIPSLQTLWSLRREATPSTPSRGGFFGVGDPALEGEAVERGRGQRGAPLIPLVRQASGSLLLADPQALRRMNRLPGTAAELEQMRAAFGAPQSALLTGAAATESAVRSTDLSRAPVVVFATHGLMAGETAESAEPGLVLTPPLVPSAADDGLLSASEVAGLQLNAEWVILSACNTATGQADADGRALSDLARAFFYAGARALLASHWPVRDDVAAVLTVRAITLQRDNPALSRGEAFAQAMREVRLERRADADGVSWAHPNAWAPFSLFGDGGD